MTAEKACADYERWSAEIKRLTAEIANTRCPVEETTAEAVEQGTPVWVDPVPSCFRRAAQTMIPPMYPDDGERPIRLAEIAPLVADCPDCTRLVELIAARKQARQRLGIAKRAIRAAGKRQLREAA